ncbi:GntR family transcriptional regulator [Bifidobacterium mongoliense]|uniref:GntR family transcriptional regulator n=1 Tax=Bifidobacterium mongoliense TaxID=518643 RepID=UPI002648508C|nr:GntR family transcriptional regulator [Bifidobacterium mongoliense]MDN5634016.1 GntR family transcriptional regulator [Bifidobacterium mongoliense]
MLKGHLRIQSLGDQITDDLRSSIIHGQLPKGERIIETEVAQRYGVSRGPVRDALQQLTNEGLVVRGRQGCVISGLSQKDVRDMYEVRVCFEELAMTHIANDPSSIDWRGMDEAIQDMRDALQAGDTNRYAQADLNFHHELIVNSQNSRMIAFWSVIKPLFSIMLQVTNAQDVDLTPSFEDHVAILDSLKSGADADVATLIDRHLEGSLNRMIRTMPTLQ